MNKKAKFALIVLASAYCLYHYYTTALGEWHFIDSVNLIIHEAGHFAFYPFGEFIAAAGGSLLQIIVPLIFFIYFALNAQKNSAAVMLLWMSVNFFNVAHYAGDALKMELPLLGGDNSIHDWNYLLLESGMIRHTETVASAINFLGFASVLGALWLAWSSFRELEGYRTDWM